MDYFYSLEDLLSIQKALPFLAPDLISQSAAACWWNLSANHKRVNFCLQCALDDLTLTRVPVWRRDWSHWWYLLCSRHCCILRPLNDQYRIVNVIDRNAAVMRMIYNGKSIARSHNMPFTKTGWFSEKQLYQEFYSKKSSEMQLALAVFSKMATPVQADIAYHYSIDGLETPPERVVMILDLVRLLLRRHTRGVDPPAYAYQLFNVFFWRPAYQYNSGMHGDVAAIFDRVEEGVDPVLRLIALAIVSYLLDYPDADLWWAVIAESGGRLGTLIPDSLGWLYAVVSGQPNAELKSWYQERIATYSPIGQEQCWKFAAAPLCLQRISKRVSDLF